MERARTLQWMFFEQYSHEPYIAVARFQMEYLGKSVSELEARLVERGTAALKRMDEALEGGGPGGPTLAGNRLAEQYGISVAGFDPATPIPSQADREAKK